MMVNAGNFIAVLALLAWPAVVAVMFRKLPIERALIWSILGGYMILPQVTAINIPAIPNFDKVTIPNLAAFIACMGIWGRMPSLVPNSWVGRVLLLAFLLSPSFTVLSNLQPVFFGVDSLGMLQIVERSALEIGALPGLRMYDSASALAYQLLLMLPFFLAREVLRSEAALREILLALVIAGAIYTLPMLFEIRFSPQLHTRLYGFFQHDFIQAIRAGGYRPFVFMPHGLWVAFFAFMVLMAAVALRRLDHLGRRKLWNGAVAMGILLIIICKSLGPIMFSLIFAPIAAFLRPRAHLTIAVVLATVVITYPALRGLDLVPTGEIVSWLERQNPDRAQSLQYRFGNEDAVLNHAAQKPLLGWGGWGRFFPYDPETGRTEVVVDGMWIITIGNYGWLGYTALFGLLTLPLFTLWKVSRAAEADLGPAASILALILAVNLVDLLPNATLIPFTWLLCGALLGHAEELTRQVAERRRSRLAALRQGVVLGRADLAGSGPLIGSARRNETAPAPGRTPI